MAFRRNGKDLSKTWLGNSPVILSLGHLHEIRNRKELIEIMVSGEWPIHISDTYVARKGSVRQYRHVNAIMKYVANYGDSHTSSHRVADYVATKNHGGRSA
jgi:hypothetical protein